jgi:hypothetical protein
VAGLARPLNFAATLTEASPGAVALQAEVEIDKKLFNMTANRLGMLRDPTTVSVVAHFTRTAATA